MNQEKIGKFIAKLRKEKKLTQEELAEKLNVNSRTISRWETGNSIPDISMFTNLSKILGVSINDLMSGEIVKKEEYQDKFEENVVEVVSKSKNKKWHKFWLCVYIITMVTIIGFICYIKIPFKQAYDKNKMAVIIKDTSMPHFVYTTTYDGNIKLLIRYNSKKEKLFFIRLESTLYDMREKNVNIDKQDVVDLTRGPSYEYEHFVTFVPDENYKIYYTNVKFSKIVNASEKELEKIIKNSYLMLES